MGLQPAFIIHPQPFIHLEFSTKDFYFEHIQIPSVQTPNPWPYGVHSQHFRYTERDLRKWHYKTNCDQIEDPKSGFWRLSRLSLGICQRSCTALFITLANLVSDSALSSPSRDIHFRLRFGEIAPRIGRKLRISAISKSKKTFWIVELIPRHWVLMDNKKAVYLWERLFHLGY